MLIVWRDYIEKTSDILKGKLIIKGTRIPVELIVGYLKAGYTVEQIIEEFPDLKQDQIIACIAYSRGLSYIEVIAESKKNSIGWTIPANYHILG